MRLLALLLALVACHREPEHISVGVAAALRHAMPDLVARFDRAAGLRHDELTARTIYVAQRENRGGAREARG